MGSLGSSVGGSRARGGSGRVSLVCKVTILGGLGALGFRRRFAELESGELYGFVPSWDRGAILGGSSSDTISILHDRAHPYDCFSGLKN